MVPAKGPTRDKSCDRGRRKSHHMTLPALLWHLLMQRKNQSLGPSYSWSSAREGEPLHCWAESSRPLAAVFALPVLGYQRGCYVHLLYTQPARLISAGAGTGSVQAPRPHPADLPAQWLPAKQSCRSLLSSCFPLQGLGPVPRPAVLRARHPTGSPQVTCSVSAVRSSCPFRSFCWVQNWTPFLGPEGVQ